MNYIRAHYFKVLVAWIAFVFLQSLAFKFSGSYETLYIFDTLGEFFGFVWFSNYGAYIVGTVELIAALLLFTRWWPWGAWIAFEVMSGAIIFHLFTPLGIEMPVYDQAGTVIGHDAGLLFIMACFTWAAALALIIRDWTAEHSVVRSTLSSLGKSKQA